MMKVSTPPHGNVCKASAYAFQVLKTSKVTNQSYLYTDMLRILTMIGAQKRKADLALIKNCHIQVKTHLDFMMAED